MKEQKIGGVIYLGYLDRCNVENCDKMDLVDHHVAYEPQEIVKVLCRSCHIKFHKKYPDEMHSRPKTFEPGKSKAHKNKWTTISLHRTTKHQLENYAIDIGMMMNDSWNDFLRKLLDDAKSGYRLKARYGLK